MRVRSIFPAALAAALLGSLPPLSRADGPDVSNGTVVHIGDSFVDAGLRQTLEPKFRAEKTRYVAESKTNSYLGSWLSPAQPILGIYWRYRPSLFLVTLGANEMMAPPESRVTLVRQISTSFKGVPCVWITIPPWKGAPMALMDMVKREAAPCRVFDSSAVADKIPRQSDGRHPTMEGGAVWAEAIWAWLLAERDRARGPWALKPVPQPGPPFSGTDP